MSPVIEVRQLHERYGDTVAVDDISFEVHPGEIFAKLSGGQQRIQFRPSVPLPDHLLESLPDVTNVIHRGDVVVVTGNSNALNAVTSALARNQILARQLRVDQE